MTRYLLAVAAGTLLLLSGIIHGLRTDRWWVSDARQALAGRLPRVPVRVGAWVGEDVPLDARQMRIARADAWLSRRYVRATPGQERVEVTVLLLAGPAQPMAVHTPDVCFANAGYRMESGARVHRPAANGPDSFWQARFSRPSEATARRVYWAWSDGGSWRAAEDARSEYNHASALYKIYLVCASPRNGSDDSPDAAQQLLADLLPDLHRGLRTP